MRDPGSAFREAVILMLAAGVIYLAVLAYRVDDMAVQIVEEIRGESRGWATPPPGWKLKPLGDGRPRVR